MKNPLYLTGMLLIFGSAEVHPQQSDPVALSRVWELAADSYPALTEKQADIEVSEYRKKELRAAAYLPQVQLQLQNTYGSFAGTSGAFFPLPGVFNVNGGNAVSSTGTMNSFGSVVADWKLIQFGKQQKMLASAGHQVEEAKSNYDAGRLMLRAKVTRLYLNLLHTSSNLHWADKNAARVKEVLDLSVSLAAAGLKPGADTALASSAYFQALAHREEWQGKYNSAELQLKEVAPSLTGPLVLPLSAYMQRSAALQENDTISAAHPFLQVLQHRLKYRQTEEQVAVRKQLPSVSLLAGVSSRGSGIQPDGTVRQYYSSGFDHHAQNYLVGFGLSWNLSGLYTGALEKKRTQKQTEAVAAAYQLQKLQMNTVLQALSARIAAQLRQLDKTGEALRKTSQAYDLYWSRYEAGLISLTDLLQIQLLLQQAEKSNIEVHQELWSQLNSSAELSGDYSHLFTQFK